MGAILGFIGQTSAIHNAMTAIIPAKSISPELIDRGFRESFMPSFWGFGILVFSVIMYFAFLLVLRLGSKNTESGSSPRKLDMGKAICVILLLAFSACPAVAFAEQKHEIPDILISEVWAGKGAPDDIVFRLWVTDEGSLSGEAHTLRDGKHRTQSPAVQVAWDDPELEIRMNTGVIFRGTLDQESSLIDGELLYKGKQIAKLPLTSTDPGDVKGLLARPAQSPEKPLYSYSVPAEVGDGWRTAGPESVGLERTALEELVSKIIQGEAGLLHSLIIACGEKLILEEYFHGYERDDLHRIASVTKSVSSLITGVAIDRGEISGVDARLADFFPQHGKIVQDNWNDVTLRHLLTMSIGTAWTEEEADRVHGAGDEFFKKLLSRGFAYSPGEKWQYVSANVNLLGGVIKAATGRHADEFAAAHLFEPLGIEEWNWDYGMVDGYRMMDGSLMLRPRSMAKLGAMVAHGGVWNEKQVVSAKWIEESTSPHMIPSEGHPEKYGYLWWLFYIPSSTGIHEAVVASGKGSQFIAVFPAFDLIVATTGSNDENGMQFAIGRLLSVYVLDHMQATN
jgi:CubicO group peptidase (beta-lactamase class C family)